MSKVKETLKGWRFWVALISTVLTAVASSGLIASTSTAGHIIGVCLTILAMLGAEQVHKKVQAAKNPFAVKNSDKGEWPNK